MKEPGIKILGPAVEPTDVMTMSPERIIVRSVREDGMTANVLQADGSYRLMEFRYAQRIDGDGFTLGKMTTKDV